MASCLYRLLVVAAVPALAVCAEPNHSWEVLMQTLQPNKTVVVTRMDSVKVEGKLLDLKPDSITVRWHDSPQVVQKQDVLRVRIANIRAKHTLIGMAVAAAIGAAVDGAAGAKSGNRADAAFSGAIMGLIPGAIIGGSLPIGKPLYEAVKPVKQPAAPPRRP